MHDHLARELRVQSWIDPDGSRRARPVRLADLGDGFKIIFAFQHWCPGCHSRGFPRLKVLHDALAPQGIGFAAIQTVFEGAEENTFDKLRIDQVRYDLPIPFGHDVALAGDELPTFMADYLTGGTPWFTVIDPDRQVLVRGFDIDVEALIRALSIPTAPATG